LRFADQEVYVLRHDHITGYYELMPPAHSFQHGEKQVTTVRSAEQRLPVITTASDEMQVSGAVIAF
jgi:hypothetical protein